MVVWLHGWKFAPTAFQLWLLMHPRGFLSASLKVEQLLQKCHYEDECFCTPLSTRTVSLFHLQKCFVIKSVRTTTSHWLSSVVNPLFCMSYSKILLILIFIWGILTAYSVLFKLRSVSGLLLNTLCRIPSVCCEQIGRKPGQIKDIAERKDILLPVVL